MVKHWSLILSVIIATLLITACQSQTEKIKIGVIAPLTGDSAVFGLNTKAGAEFAYAQLPPALKEKYELVIEDDQLDNAKTVSAYQKLKNIDGIKAVIGVSSGSGNAIAALAEQDKTLFCSIASDPAIVEGRQYVFKHWTTPEEEARRYVEEAKKLGWKKIVNLQSNQQGVQAITDALIPAANAAGIEVETHVIDMDVKDARTILTKLEGEEFDAFIILLLPAHIEAIARQIKEMGFEQPLTAIETFEYVKGDGLKLFEDQWYVTAADPTSTFAAEFEAANGEKPGIGVPNGYDCFNIIVKAFEESDSTPDGAAAIVHALHDYDGAMGTLYYNKGSIESPAVKKIVKNGEFITAE